MRAVKKIFRTRAKRIAAARHGIAASDIDADAADAVARLQKAGHEAYIVGGAVRDLLLGAAPKDFDVSTAAMPDEIKKLFRRARVIGRRFQIMHLPIYRRGVRKVIETATFRADGDEVVHDGRGRILTDNSYGDAAQDAFRRDFSCNALFYNPADGCIIDYAGGYEDIRRRRLCVIGAPAVRFRQDPVRMLRALRFESKLGLAMDNNARRAVRANAALLADIAPARLFDEAVKIIQSGRAADIFRNCAECGLARHVLPAAAGPFARKILEDADRRRAADKEISLSFVLAGLFWPPVAQRWGELRGEGAPPVRAMEAAAAAAEFTENPTVPRRLTARVMDLYFLQARFEARMTLRRATGIMRHPLFARA
ncbi:MAG: polynucleotide adenylyltransferase PcnB, partial [Betaproteobacteria bacterium]|nr:polynucleotide adenylyltransferase PcnB [Betaproteobacteria bacterium]